jgi:hypothetical protein
VKSIFNEKERKKKALRIYKEELHKWQQKAKITQNKCNLKCSGKKLVGMISQLLNRLLGLQIHSSIQRSDNKKGGTISGPALLKYL